MRIFSLAPFLALAAALPAPGNGNGKPDNGQHNGNGGNTCNGKGNPHCQGGSTRPTITPSPMQPRVPFPSPAVRTRDCIVPVSGGDDSEAILAALQSCNNGGRVVFEKDSTYTIGTALDLTFLQSIDLDIQGTIRFTNDTDYWQKAGFSFVFQNVTTFFKLGGDDVFIYGGGTLDGNGQAWYDLFAKDRLIMRPVLMGVDGLKNSIIADLKWRYSPQYYSFVANSSNVVFDGIDITGRSKSEHEAKNTDGWDTYRSTDITIQNGHVDNGDDCVSFKPNSTHILVQSMWCNGSHGMSVGSLGQYAGTFDIVEHVYVANISMNNASDGARIKVWPGSAASMSVDLQGGGGEGRVNNITFTDWQLSNVDYAMTITQCYGQKNATLCTEFPSKLTISDVTFKNFAGQASTKYAPQMAYFQCSSPDVCYGIRAENISVTSPAGAKEAFCFNMDNGALDVQCTTQNSPGEHSGGGK
ncbi:hypothetical protein CspHIS471_0302880 [Cutaneotrichosporon sp. HIS471]|nr:hypothetical protein CspHIS471_0302880 [Cutaneotrichosporon sp. HIS471]